MKLEEFYEAVEKQEDLQGVNIQFGEYPADDFVVVNHISTKKQVTVPAETIREHTWETLFHAITTDDENEVLWHMTRIVGYFSRIENWNKGKLGELRDRRDGDYKIDQEQQMGVREIVERIMSADYVKDEKRNKMSKPWLVPLFGKRAVVYNDDSKLVDWECDFPGRWVDEDKWQVVIEVIERAKELGYCFTREKRFAIGDKGFAESALVDALNKLEKGRNENRNQNLAKRPASSEAPEEAAGETTPDCQK